MDPSTPYPLDDFNEFEASFSVFEENMNDYLETLEKYKLLKSGDVPNVPDKQLEEAVMSWMWNKFNEDWSDQYQVIRSLPKPCQNVFSCRTVVNEVNNGGFNQLFFNSSGQFAEMSIEGFLALGAPMLNSIAQKAVALYQQNKDVLDGYNDGTLESFSASYEEKIFDELDKTFYCDDDTIDFVKYIRLHAACFGD
ncbi:MAG: DMP19 family protein [Oscillospiraceae bacterium]|nr:DMP19 family protein [Oscillospiraceae bacterium]